jgi:hypothetical protein
VSLEAKIELLVSSGSKLHPTSRLSASSIELAGRIAGG